MRARDGVSTNMKARLPSLENRWAAFRVCFDPFLEIVSLGYRTELRL
jgi:hypothetical protein